MKLPQSLVDAAEVQFFFGEGSYLFGKSTFGDQLERASIVAFDSRGNRIPPPVAGAWYVPIKHTASEPSFEPIAQDVVRVARVSRRLRKLPDAHAAVLHAYYGNVGARWSGTKPSRLFALYPLTSSGAAALAALPPSDVRPDQRMADFFLPGGRAPNFHLMQRCATEARALLADAHTAWEKTK
jgi:hypothetical protein